MLLLIDNYDSFTHNLARYFVELGCAVKVVRNDECSLDDIAKWQPQYLVISPGPCDPDQAGISLSAVQHFCGLIPILGVCLGHQTIGQVFGGTVRRAAQVQHGKTSLIYHQDSNLFFTLNNPFTATRYHSLVLDEQSLPDILKVDGWSNNSDGSREIMAISHRSEPIWGVQFHPESLLTENGHEILSNFIKLADTWYATHQ